MGVKNTTRTLFLMLSVVLAANISFGYEAWYGMPYLPKDAGGADVDQWATVAPQLQGLNANFRDAQRPDEEQNTTATWKASVNRMTAAKGNALVALPRPEFQYSPGGEGQRTLEEALEIRWDMESRYGITLKYLMLYNERPGEDLTKPVIKFTDEEVQQVRDWLDNNGRSYVILCWDVRNNSNDEHLYSEKPAFTGIMMEGSPYLWESNAGNREAYLTWALANPLVKDKEWVMQVPVRNISGMNLYESMRWFMRYIPEMLGSFDFFRRDDVSILTITYGPGDEHLPELELDGTQYGNSMMGFSLSILEQRPLFEGYQGAVTEAQAESRDRIIYSELPEEGLVAHWPLDEGSGTNANDASGYGFDGELLNGASWGSDAERGTYAVFDGTDDRISTPFKYALADSNDFTWAWWAKMEPTSHSGSIMVGNRYGNTGSETYEFIKMTPSKAAFSNTDSTGSIEDYDYTDIAASSWHHYAMVKDGTNYQWYVDGTAQGVASNFVYSETSPLPFLIGGDGDNKPNEHFEGCIDDVVLYREALTPAEITDVINGIYLPVITLTTLATPVYLTDGSVWSDSLPAHSGAGYVVPDTGNLKSEDGHSIFPGYSLTVEAGGKFQFRAKQELGETTTVNNLIATGGTSGTFVNLSAGTGNNTVNHLNGTFANDGFTKLIGYGNATGPRSIRVSSKISGHGTLHSTGSSGYPHTCTIANANNTFSGVWESNIGTLVFEFAGAVGSADITVLDTGKLQVSDDWITDATLSVADSATAEVDLGSNDWTVSNLVFGASSVAEGTYTAAELNALGANSVFTGTGTLRIGEPLPPPVYELIAGWDTWDSATAPAASVLAPHVTASAVTTAEEQSWNATDERGAGNDGDWGTFVSVPSASIVTNADNENLTLNNAATGGTITFTVANNGTDDIDFGSFHFDAYAFRPKAPRTYELSVLTGGGISGGVVFTSAAQAITEVGGAWDNGAHDDIDLSLAELADHTLGAGESVSFLLAFSGGEGDGSGGHHLFVDNVGITGAFPPGTEPSESPVLEHSMNSGSMVFSWTGTGFKVQTRTNLIEGSWYDVPGGDIPPVNIFPTNAEGFYRLIEE